MFKHLRKEREKTPFSNVRMDFCPCGKKKKEAYQRCFTCNREVKRDLCECGKRKNTEYKTCYECFESNRDRCPCGSMKEKKYPKCYTCQKKKSLN